MDNNKKKVNIIILVIALVIALTLVSIGTYAAWIWRSTVNKDVVFNTSKNVQEYIIYNESESKFIGDFQPTSTFCEGQHLTISFYKKEEAADILLNATVYMDVNSIGTNIASSSNVYWIITEGDSSITCTDGLNSSLIVNSDTFNGVSQGNTITLVSEIPVTTTNQTYTVWVWIDESGSNSSLSGETLDINVWTQIDMLPQDAPAVLKVGDYISYTPGRSSYTIDNSITYYTGGAQYIYPSELNLWRVLSVDEEVGLIDIISENVSSTDVCFYGLYGFENFPSYLNDYLGAAYTNQYAYSWRYFGYNGQLTTLNSLYAKDWWPGTSYPDAYHTSSTPYATTEVNGGGDMLYEEDYNLLLNSLGTGVANRAGTTTAAKYWTASRHYWYSGVPENYIYGARYIDNYGNDTHSMYMGGLYGRDELGAAYYESYPTDKTFCAALRPIITLESNLKYQGGGTEASPWQIVGRMS